MPYTRRSAAEWADHIRAYRESKESVERYAKRNGLFVSTFQSWIDKLKTPAFTRRIVPLIPPLAHLSIRVKDAVHRAHRGEVLPLIEQRRRIALCEVLHQATRRAGFPIGQPS